MWTCNICFKTFDRSTSYYNHRRSHNFNYKISSSEQETSSDEESSEEFSSNQIFSEKDNIYIYNNNDDEGKESDESNDDEESYESDKVEESSKSDENEIISDDLPNINEMANSTFSENDDQTSSDSDEQNFPNEIYRDFVKLVVHHKLSNNVGDAFLKFLRTHANFPKKTLPPSTRIGLQFLDNLKKKHTLFNSISIININNIQYNFEYRPILSGIEEIVSNAEIAKELVFDYNEIWINQEDGQERSYSEMFNCNWWKQAVNHAPYGSKIVPIILYSDATTLDHFGKSSRHPIFVTIGNIPTNLRNKPESKALVGLIPILESSKQMKETKEFRKAIRITFHKCFEILLAPIRVQHQTGIQLKVGNSYVWCTMIVAMILGDWPENGKYCLTYGGSKCKNPCHNCLVDRNNLNKINLTTEEMLPRTQQKMQTAINSGLTKEHSIHEQNNAFWNLPATVPEKMHHLDLGLFPYMIEFTRNLLKNQGGNALVEKMDTRLAAIPRHHGLKIFHNGLADLARFTALEYRNMMRVMPFVLDGLLDNRGLDSKLIGLYLKWNDMYRKTRKLAFTERELDDFEKLMKSWAKDFVLIGSYSNNQCQYPKLHHFLYHMIPAIKDYGSPNGWNAETFEFLHKAYIKDPYRMSNKRNVNPQILGTVMRKLTLQEVYKTIFLNKPRHFYQSNEVILYKNYNNIPFRLIETTVNELKVREGPPEIIDGLEHFLEALSEYLKIIMPDLNDEGNIIDMETAIISLYESVRLTNGKFVRATLSYNNLPMFNDISIEIDESQLEEFVTYDNSCFAKVLLLVQVFLNNNHEGLKLALIRWYDLKIQSKHFRLDCPSSAVIFFIEFM
ncbi:unnamed protein product [Rhizophagus irregularis]|nr:unnamed protein product [Rhizophagus irregularis]